MVAKGPRLSRLIGSPGRVAGSGGGSHDRTHDRRIPIDRGGPRTPGAPRDPHAGGPRRPARGSGSGRPAGLARQTPPSGAEPVRGEGRGDGGCHAWPPRTGRSRSRIRSTGARPTPIDHRPYGPRCRGGARERAAQVPGAGHVRPTQTLGVLRHRYLFRFARQVTAQAVEASGGPGQRGGRRRGGGAGRVHRAAGRAASPGHPGPQRSR
jgi:hypothetical protein